MKVQSKRQAISTSDLSSSTASFVEVVFGAPSKQCTGYGICKVEAISTQMFEKRVNDRIENSGVGVIAYEASNLVSFEFYLSSLSVNTIYKQFRTGKFFLSETLILKSKSIWQSNAGLPIKINVPIGLYKLKYTETTIRIEFEI